MVVTTPRMLVMLFIRTTESFWFKCLHSHYSNKTRKNKLRPTQWQRNASPFYRVWSQCSKKRANKGL